MRDAKTASPSLARNTDERRPTYRKVFRWQIPAGQTTEPKSVEIIGSFTDWQPVPLLRKAGRDT